VKGWKKGFLRSVCSNGWWTIREFLSKGDLWDILAHGCASIMIV
jgi:hypothetical protein